MVNPEESQVKDEREMSADTKSDLGEGKEDHADDVGEVDRVEDCSRRSESLYEEDQIYLRSLLPEELWRMILDLLADNPEDFKNCINASPYFWELQREGRVIFLFSDIFQIIANRIEARYSYQPFDTDLDQPDESDLQGQADMDGDNEEEMVDGEEDDILEDDEDQNDDGDAPQDRPGPEVKNKDWKDAVLNCRLVCTTWNKAIESYYSRPDIRGIEEFKNDLDPRAPVNLLGVLWIDRNLGFGSVRETERFMQHFGQTHHSDQGAPPKNPIPSRYISLYDSLHDEMETLNALVKLVKVFGNGLWYMHMNIRPWGLEVEEDQYYLKIRELLSYTPNLKYLHFERVSTSNQVSPALVAAHPMPKLDNIMMIDVDFDSGGTLIKEVIKANRHVPHLKLGDELEIDEEIGAIMTSMSAFSANIFVDDFEVKMMQKYGPTWKLEKASTGDFKGLFPLLEKNWANTLMDLELYFFNHRNPNIMEGLKDSKLNLPNLRRLRLFVEDFIVLDFILPLANTLEYLEIETLDPKSSGNGRREKRDAEGKNQKIEYAGYENRMEQSNIWGIFKKLKTIKVKWTRTWASFLVYTRQGEKLIYRFND